MVPAGVTISLSRRSSSILQYGWQGMGIFITRLKVGGEVCALACSTILANPSTRSPEKAMAVMMSCLRIDTAPSIESNITRYMVVNYLRSS